VPSQQQRQQRQQHMTAHLPRERHRAPQHQACIRIAGGIFPHWLKAARCLNQGLRCARAGCLAACEAAGAMRSIQCSVSLKHQDVHSMWLDQGLRCSRARGFASCKASGSSALGRHEAHSDETTRRSCAAVQPLAGRHATSKAAGSQPPSSPLLFHCNPPPPALPLFPNTTLFRSPPCVQVTLHPMPT